MYPDIQLVVIEGRGCNRFLRSWAGRFRNRRIISVSDLPDHLVCHRNRVFKWFRDECRLPWLLTMDDDMVPLPETDELLRSASDIAAARAWGKTGMEAHPEPGEFSMACVKVHRRVVEAIEPPWFQFEYSADGVAQASCECSYFARKARAAGFHSQHVGRVGHRMAVTVAPGLSGPELIFDDQVAALMKGGGQMGVGGSGQSAE